MSMMQMLLGAGGKAAGLNPQDVFAAKKYTGSTSTPLAVESGVDLAGKGGLVWLKSRTSSHGHAWIDSGTPAWKGWLESAGESAQQVPTGQYVTPQSDGFDIPSSGTFMNDDSSTDYMSWAFRKAEGFFDVVTYEGNGSTQTISHGLNCVPGMIIIKNKDESGNWVVWHKGLANTTARWIPLQGTGAQEISSTVWNSTAPTKDEFTVGDYSAVNWDEKEFVAYLFADGDSSDGQVFGPSADESIIKMGSYTGTGSGSYRDLDFGWEPQWLLTKRKDDTGNWAIYDTERGMSGSADGSGNYFYWLAANYTSAEEGKTYIGPAPQSDGVHIYTGHNDHNGGSSREYIYVAIRKPIT